MYILDGSGYIFRAFYAVQRLTTKAGFPTNALFGFTRMLVKLLKTAGSAPVVAVFDAGKQNFRHELYPEYKANRKECPPELAEQMPYFSKIAEAFGLPVLKEGGFEADDIIATLVKHFSPTTHITVVSADKDLLQLVGPNVTVWDTMKDIKFSRAEVIEKMGVPPELVPELLALAGDSSDNVPGLDGVGPKTAVQLVTLFGSIENVIAKASEIRGVKEIRGRDKVADQLLADPSVLRLSRKLVELNRAVPLEGLIGPCEGDSMPLDSHPLLVRNPIDPASLKATLAEFEFSSLADELLASQTEQVRPVYDVQVVYRDDFRGFAEKLSKQPTFAFDLETTSLNPLEAKIVSASFSWNSGCAFYVPISHTSVAADKQVLLSDFLNSLREVFESVNYRKVGQNLKYDLTVLNCAGVKVDGVYFDTMVAAYLLNPDRGSYNLTTLSEEFLGTPVIEFDAVLGDKTTFAEVAIDAAAQYCGQDSILAWRVYEHLRPQLEGHDLMGPLATLEMPLVPVLAAMEGAGVLVDRQRLAALSEEFGSRLEKLQGVITELAGKSFNLNSPKQLAEILFVDLALPTKGIKKTKTGFSTDSDSLDKLAAVHPLPKHVLEYRGLFKLKSTYIDTLPEQIFSASGRIHTRYNQTGTATGRLSSSDPNLQNIPIQSEDGRRIREAFIAAPGFALLSADYSQIELRILAHLSGDPALIAAFKNGQDIHSATAREILGVPPGSQIAPDDRRMGKVINFGIIYGMGPHRLSGELGIPYKVAESYIDNYFARYAGVRAFFDAVETSAKAKGEVRTLFGRRRVVSEIASDGRDSGFLLRAALNAPLQGTAADIIKLAMIRLYRELPQISPKSRMLLQIHDELVLEVPEGEVEALAPKISELMQGVVELAVPLVVDTGFGHNWNEAHS